MKKIQFLIMFILLSFIGCSTKITPSSKELKINIESKGSTLTIIKYNKDTGDTYAVSKVIAVFIDKNIASKLNKKDKDIIYSNLLKKLEKSPSIKTALYYLKNNNIYLILSENHKKPTIGIKMIITDINDKKLKTIMIIKFLKLLNTYKNEEK